MPQLNAGSSLTSEPHEAGRTKHLTVLTGSFQVSAELDSIKILAGQTARFPENVKYSIQNYGRTTTTGLMVVMHPQ